VRWVQARDLSESIRQVRLCTHAVKYNMLEMCPPALCAYERRPPLRWYSHSWLCSVQYSTAVMRDSDAHIATCLESYPCTSTHATGVESYSCKKSRGAPPPTTPTQLGAARVPHPSVSRVRFFPARSRGGVNLATPLLRAPNLPKMGLTATGLAAELSTGFSGLRAHEAGSSSPLECALTPKQGWGVPPPTGFSQ
jgi:hypothetical protein